LARTVLLADDSVTAQNMGRRILTDAGYEVITVNNGSAALKKVHESQPDLIVLDVYMPGYGGLEVCQRLKESGETMRIPVLLTVGKMEPFKADEAKRVRADAHIIKPFEASELLAALAKLEDRIVPPADPSRGLQGKKPSFWHSDDINPAAQRDWSENAAYLAQVKERKGNEDVSGNLEPAQNAEPEPAPIPVKRAFPRVPEATEELPVIADANAVPAPEFGREERPTAKAEAPSPASVTEATGFETSTADTGTSDGTQPSEDFVQSSEDRNRARQAPEMSEVPSASAVEEVAAAHEAEEMAVAGAPGRWVAENIALSPEEAALELEQEMYAAEAAVKAQAETPKQVPASSPVPPVPDQADGATFAAAAAASASGTVSSTPVRADDDAEVPAASEAAAAWENWQHIRESVMNLQNAASIAETAAQAKASMPQESSVQSENVSASPEASATTPAATDSSTAEASSSSGLETGALASIVDSVLAELKPKLMEEIAKKLKK